MGYSIHWIPGVFTDVTYDSVTSVLSELIDPGTTLTVEPWGFTIGLEHESESESESESEDSVSIVRDPKSSHSFCKTNRAPYTKDVMKALILMVEFGAAVQLDHSDEDMSEWLTALEFVQVLWPLVSYGHQKTYFSRGLSVSLPLA